MKRNKLTLLCLVIIVILTLTMWIVPKQFTPIQVQSQDDTIMEWEKINFKLRDKTDEHDSVEIQYQDNQFNHLLYDINGQPSYRQTIYSEVYGAFSLLNRPNLREYQIINPNGAVQLWYFSNYLKDYEQGPLVLDYTVVDKENSNYIELSHTFTESDYTDYQYLSYAEDEAHFYLLLELSNAEYTNVKLHQLTINKETAEVQQDDIIKYEEVQPYNILSIEQINHPNYHVIGINKEVNSLSDEFTSRLQEETYRSLIILNPRTLEIEEVELPSYDSEKPSSRENHSTVILNNENLYYFNNESVISDEGELENYQMSMFEYDQQGNEFTEIWSKKGDNNTRFTLQSGQLFLGIIDSEQNAHIEHVALNTGEVERTKEFVITEKSDYQFESLEFGYQY